MQKINSIYTTSVIKLKFWKAEHLDSHYNIIKQFIHVRKVWKEFGFFNRNDQKLVCVLRYFIPGQFFSIKGGVGP